MGWIQNRGKTGETEQNENETEDWRVVREFVWLKIAKWKESTTRIWIDSRKSNTHRVDSWDGTEHKFLKF